MKKLLMLALLLASSISAQSAQSLDQNVYTAMHSGRYLQALRAAEGFEHSTRGQEDQHSYAVQVLSWVQSYVGETDQAIATADAGWPGDPPNVDPSEWAGQVKTAQVQDALSAIVAAARTHHIVILNEAHHIPESRAFARQVMEALRPLGFRYFAAETFAPGVVDSTRSGYPTIQSGYYSVEPLFGDLIRGALAAGYTLVPYETEVNSTAQDPDTQINDRETQQSANLMARIFKKDPAARVFIYVGYSHALEAPVGKLRWMASRLKAATGQDPLTIDQTEGFAHPDRRFESPIYAALTAQGPLDGPKVLRRPDGRFMVGSNYAGLVDLQVFHPRPTLVQGRPSWLGMGGYRKPLAAPAAWQPATGRMLLQAFRLGEPGNAVPVDQVLLQAGHEVPVLMLPAGRYRLVLQDEQGRSYDRGLVTQP